MASPVALPAAMTATRTRCAERRSGPSSRAWPSLTAALLPVAALALCLLPATPALAEVASASDSSDLLTTNHQLLSGLGLARLPGQVDSLQGLQGIPPGLLPNKRVPATEDDSRVFVVRLPPSQHYYSLLKSPPSLANSVSKQVEVGFRSNGKPARVYHWNIPVLKKMAAARRRSTQGSGGGGHGGAPVSGKPSKNPSKNKLGATRRKQAATYHRVQQQQQQQIKQQQLQQQQLKQQQLKQQPLKQQQLQQLQQQLVDVDPEPAGPSPYYYVPAKKTAMHKLLGGNGKPHTMYVLEKSRAPAYYQRLLP